MFQQRRLTKSQSCLPNTITKSHKMDPKIVYLMHSIHQGLKVRVCCMTRMRNVVRIILVIPWWRRRLQTKSQQLLQLQPPLRSLHPLPNIIIKNRMMESKIVYLVHYIQRGLKVGVGCMIHWKSVARRILVIRLLPQVQLQVSFCCI